MKKMIFSGITALLLTGTAYALEPETTAPEATETLAPEEGYYEERRFSSITETGANLQYNRGYFSLYQAVGIRVNHHLFIGQGVGLQTSGNGYLQLQATADVRAYVLKRNLTPVFGVQAGLNKVSKAPESYEKKIGDTQFVLNAGTGLHWQALPNAAFTLNGGYSLYTDFKGTSHGGFVRIGYVF